MYKRQGREAPPAEQGGPQDTGTPALSPDTGGKHGSPGADGRAAAGDSAGNNRPGTDNGQVPAGGPGRNERQDGSPAHEGDSRASDNLTPRVFLNQPRSIESTLLKVQVADLAAARKALLAESAGLPYQSFGRQQVDGHTVEILRFVVPAERASSFTAVAAGLGRVVDRQYSRQDISQQFAASLDHYRDLIARRNTAGSDTEKADLDRQIRELEQQLSTWDAEAGRQVVVVWLQQ
ncbi:hypothetical protein GFC01_13890 [Desulfofundulus thermobenzoicus]|uniref:DUF4349 domain-containing protein n=1 Tax=Desulfofundulus thermobenzoicus TaxID=29376 RepID=A0A6N7IV58_9FIRM|nr:hypothetical protein [Desulfofundulus thermobenzoicus]MQL53327.1 hypothetical protein [Desulfofundulus thermobenzoicus]